MADDKKKRLGGHPVATGVLVALALFACAVAYTRYVADPWTRNGQIASDIVMIAPEIAGVVLEVPVADNQRVREGDPLFVIDPVDYELMVASARVALDQARQRVASLEAAVEAAEASVSEADAGITTAEAAIESARAQVLSAEGSVASAQAAVQAAEASVAKAAAGLDEATSDRDRAGRLAADGAGSVARAESMTAAAEQAKATLDGANASERQARAEADRAAASLASAQAGLSSAAAGLTEAQARRASAEAKLVQALADLGEPGDANTEIRAAQVALAQAERDLVRTRILAPSDGYVTNLQVDPGDYASPGVPLLAFVDETSFRVQGYFRETQLRRIAPGDRAIITLMSNRGTPIEGVVDSIGWAINPPDIATTQGTSGLVPQVQPSFDWIRLAQRVPVRIRIESVPDGVRLVSGTTASITIEPSSR